MTTCLLALGDATLRDACKAALHAEGHAALVLDRPLAALSLAAKLTWDAMLVDDTPLGREALRTAGSDTRVVGLGCSPEGVDQALAVPLNTAELLSALSEAVDVEPGTLALDAQRRVARVDGSEVPLTRIEFRLLEALRAQGPGDVALDQLLRDVWGTTVGVGTAELVRTHVRNLRQKLAQIGLPDAIRSHRGRGYALEA
jgi:DNA-binding response OmpR family regulator